MLPESDRIAYPLREFARRAGIGVTTCYHEIRSGRLRVRKVGRASIVAASDAEAWLAGLPQGVAAERSSAQHGRTRARRPATTITSGSPSGTQPQEPRQTGAAGGGRGRC
jgi:hypothetical protein